jgi:hypothetical protein
MLWAKRVIVTAALMTAPYLWMVGQSTFEAANRNICEALNDALPWQMPTCRFHVLYAALWAVVLLAAFVSIAIDSGRWIRKATAPHGGVRGFLVRAASPISVSTSPRFKVIGAWILITTGSLGLVAGMTMLFIGRQSQPQVSTSVPPTPAKPTVDSKPPEKLTPDSFRWYGESEIFIDAAKKAYAETRTTVAGGLAEENDASADQIFLWYAYALINLEEVWGVRPPSDKFEPLNLKGYKLTYDTRTIEAPIPGHSVSYSRLRILKAELQDAIEKIKDIQSRPDWIPEKLIVTAPLQSPSPTVKKELVARARFLYDQRSDTMVLINKQDLELATVEKNNDILSPRSVIFGQSSFIARFVFFREIGPFDVDVAAGTVGSLMTFAASVSENEKNYVKLQLYQTLSATAITSATLGSNTTLEITVSFYRK